LKKSLAKFRDDRITGKFISMTYNTSMFIWTKHGVTNLRMSEEAKAMAIKTEDDLMKYGLVNS